MWCAPCSGKPARCLPSPWRLYLAFCFEWNRIAYKDEWPHLTQPEVLRDKRGRLTSDDERLILIPAPIRRGRRSDAKPRQRTGR